MTEMYKVEKILKKKVNKNGSFFFLKWEGYPLSQATWEPLENLTSIDYMIKEFEEENQNSSENIIVSKTLAKDKDTIKPKNVKHNRLLNSFNNNTISSINNSRRLRTSNDAVEIVNIDKEENNYNKKNNKNNKNKSSSTNSNSVINTNNLIGKKREKSLDKEKKDTKKDNAAIVTSKAKTKNDKNNSIN